MSILDLSSDTSLQALAERTWSFDPSWKAVEFEHRWYSWGEIRKVADEVRAAIRASGAEPRQPVAFAPRNRPWSFGAWLALLAEGRTIQMVYAFQAPAAVAHNLERLKPSIFVAGESELGEEVRAVLGRDGIAAILFEETGARALPGFERATRAPAADAPAEPEIQILTSGTTGPPKQAPFPQSLFARHHALPPILGRPDADWQAETPPPFLCFPLGNIAGVSTTLPCLLRGQPFVLADRFTLAGWLDWVARYKPVVAGLPPAGVRMLLDTDTPASALGSVKYITSGAAPVDPRDQREFEARYGIPILLSYGATEFGGIVVIMTPALAPEWAAKKFGTVGRPIPGARIRVIDPDTGAVLPPGQEGLLEVVSPRIGPDWIRTSDLAVIDEDGFMYHRGRADGAIMRGGFKLVPEVIENALLKHPAIGVAAVVGRKDARLGEAPVAALQLMPGAEAPSIEELEAHVREHLPATFIPVDWKILPEMPRTQSMKVDRGALKQLFADS